MITLNRTLQDDNILFEQLTLTVEKLLHQLGQGVNPSVLLFNNSSEMSTLWLKYGETLNQFFARVNAWCEQNLPFSVFALFWRDDTTLVLLRFGMAHGDEVTARTISKTGFVDIPDPENELVFQCFRGFLELCAFGQLTYQGEA
jgi:hypothetical protein